MPFGLWALFSSAVSFGLMMFVILMIAGWDLVKMFRMGSLEPGAAFLLGALACLALRPVFFPQISVILIVVLFSLFAAGFHVWRYEQGREEAVLDLLSTFSGILYLGIFGGFFNSIRVLDGGDWWVYLVLSAVWLADTGAYFFGRWFGKKKLAPRLSPKKTVVGYVAGVISAMILNPLLLTGYRAVGLDVPSEITIYNIFFMSSIIGLIAPIGDLTISMFKRYYHLKDSGSILMSHGGMLDRIDSWLWGVTVGYFLITELIL